jgi:hypothetical protein
MSAPSVSGTSPGLQAEARHAEREVAAVAHVHLQARSSAAPHDGVQLAVPVHEAAGVAGEGVRQDVARLHQLHHCGRIVSGSTRPSPPSGGAQSWPKWM